MLVKTFHVFGSQLNIIKLWLVSHENNVHILIITSKDEIKDLNEFFTEMTKRSTFYQKRRRLFQKVDV